MLAETDIKECVIWACEQEVKAPKPGNVNCFGGAYNMEVNDFLASAHAIAPIMAKPGLTVGEKILQSIQATRAVVNCNTNLGIILLFAPICCAIEQTGRIEEIPLHLESVLSSLTVEDARLAYQAIRMAEAGGLGKAREQDINEDPSVTLLAAMTMAAERDTIACQYTNNFREVRTISLPALKLALTWGESVEWATAFAYLKLLSKIPDSLIERKQSKKHAQAVTKKAQQLVFKMNKNNKLRTYQSELTAWDNELKREALNPGTSADIIAATLLLFAFEQRLPGHGISVP